MASNGGYKKQLEGVKSTSELRELLQKSIDYSIDDSSPDSVPDELTSVVSRATVSLPAAEARSIVVEYNKKEEVKDVIPISVLKAMSSLLLPDKKLSLQSEKALSETSLVFTAPPPPEKETDEQRRFRKRMDRLRLRAEEMQYKDLVGNLDTYVPDDVTTRSMTYAASVGLNMIIAPLSFGAFMYFFAGPIFSWVLGDQEMIDPNKADIRRVIAGVVCGVGMLFIEMILFVIRTHEFDASMRKKAKKKSPSPFGYTKPMPKAT